MTSKLKVITRKIKSLNSLLKVLSLFRAFIYFYSALSLIFWVLNCFEVGWLYKFNWLFLVPYKLVSTFYTPKGVSADFSLAIIGLISFCIALVFEYIINHSYNVLFKMEDEQEKLRIQKRKLREQKIASKKSMNLSNAFYNSNLVFLITFQLNKIKRSKNDLELSFQEYEEWKKLVNKSLLKSLTQSPVLQKGYYRGNLFLVYRDFNYAERFIFHLKPTLYSTILEYKREGILVTFSYVLSSVSDIHTLEKELDCMDTIFSLNFKDSVIVTNRFKIVYESRNAKNYDISLKGEYNLSKNLTIANNQPVYMLVEKVKKENE